MRYTATKQVFLPDGRLIQIGESIDAGSDPCRPSCSRRATSAPSSALSHSVAIRGSCTAASKSTRSGLGSRAGDDARATRWSEIRRRLASKIAGLTSRGTDVERRASSWTRGMRSSRTNPR